MSSIADALDCPCRVRHSYGLMLHHHGISFSVDYNSQKPLIKPCASKAFCLLLFYNYLSLERERSPQICRSSLPVQQRERKGQVPNKSLNPTKQFVLTEVCLWGIFSMRLVFLFNLLPCLIVVWGVYTHKTFVKLMTVFGILERPQLCLAFSVREFKPPHCHVTAHLTFSWCNLAF